MTSFTFTAAINKMSLFRPATVLPHLLRQCARTSTITSVHKRGYADMAFTFACPGGVYYDNAKVKQIDVPSFSGSFGILPDHVPLLAVLQPGVMVVHEDDGSQNKFFVSSGSVSINDDSSVQILAEEAVKVGDLDPQAVRDGFSKAQQELTSASSEKAKAEAQISLDCFEAMQKAIH